MTATFVALLSRYLAELSWEAFHALWAFPKAVLAPLGRGGRSTRGQLAREDAAAQERLHGQVLRSVGNGALAKALNLFTSDGVQDAADPKVLSHLRKLHPPETPPGYGPREARPSRLTCRKKARLSA